jgi:hypothetical protein
MIRPSMQSSWIGPYVQPVPIRCRGALHFYSCQDAAGRPHVVVMAPYLARQDACARLRGLSRAHRLVAGLHVPGVAAESFEDATPWVALDCDAVADLEVVTDALRQSGQKPDFEQSSSLGKTLLETLARCHAVRDPESGEPVCLGSVSPANVLVGAGGSLWFVGFGAGPLHGAFVAPEVAAGATATPGADVYALTLFLRSMIHLTHMPSVARRVFGGRSIRGDAKLVALFAWSNLKILAGSPRHRPTAEATLERARSLWKLLGFSPDVAGFRAILKEAIRAEPRGMPASPGRPAPVRVVIRNGGEWLETPHGRHALGTRGPLRRVLVALAEAQTLRAGAALTVDDLLTAGWPGERPLPEAANNRVWVTISTLRKLGLGEVLQRWDGGYRLDPAVPCHFEAA